MKNRLRRREREAIRSKYALTELLYKAMGKGARELEKRMGHFRFSAEELFVMVMSRLDDVKECPQDASEALDDWWNTLYCDFRDLDTAESPDEEIRLATSEVVYVTLLLLGMCRDRYCQKLPAILMAQLTEHHPGIFDELQQWFLPELWRIGEERVHIRMNTYMDSEEWISDDIAEELENLPVEVQQPLLDTGKESVKVDSQFTNRQLVILFGSLLDVSFSSQFTNIKALARLISKVSGHSEGSVRTCINSGIDYDKPSVKNDVEVVATLLDAIKPKLAQMLKNNVE